MTGRLRHIREQDELTHVAKWFYSGGCITGLTLGFLAGWWLT